MVDEAERALNDALCVVRNAIEDQKYVAGGGAAEVEVARQLRKYAESVGGKEQLAIEAFADAVEIVPKTLAENSGHDPLDALVALRAEHDKGKKTYGLNIQTGKPDDMLKLGVLEPLRVKKHAIKSASEAASMILRIDDVIASKPHKEEKEKEKGETGKLPETGGEF
ncbi:MAG: TCP-1/cpn60 chaperonin family protein [Candidatus Jordarchaeales archaeon]